MNICFIFALSSCAVSEKKWHESVSKLGGLYSAPQNSDQKNTI